MTPQTLDEAIAEVATQLRLLSNRRVLVKNRQLYVADQPLRYPTSGDTTSYISFIGRGGYNTKMACLIYPPDCPPNSATNHPISTQSECRTAAQAIWQRIQLNEATP
jgi:hypothetical protein